MSSDKAQQRGSDETQRSDSGQIEHYELMVDDPSEVPAFQYHFKKSAVEETTARSGKMDVVFVLGRTARNVLKGTLVGLLLYTEC